MIELALELRDAWRLPVLGCCIRVAIRLPCRRSRRVRPMRLIRTRKGLKLWLKL